ncbi:hypothetical protein Tco_1428881 [Tanacetum coccineum]
MKQAKLEKLNDKVKLEESKARFDKWKDSSKNLDKLIHSSMSSRSNFGLGFGELFGSDEVFVPNCPLAYFGHTPEDVAEKLSMTVTYGSKSNNYFETNSASNDFVSYDNSDKSSDSETSGPFASCVSSVKSSSSKTNEPLASAPSSVAFQTMSETADQQPSSTNVDSSFSVKENVKPPRNLYSSFVPKAAYVPVVSRNRPTSVPAGRPFSAGWKNHVARPMTRPTSHYFQHFSRTDIITICNMDEEMGTLVSL